MKTIRKRWAIPIVAAVLLATTGAAYASAPPNDDDANAALTTLQQYVAARPTATVTQTVTVTPSPVTSTVTQTVTAPPSTVTVTVTGSPSPTTSVTPTTSSPSVTPITSSPTPTTSSPSPSATSASPSTSPAVGPTFAPAGTYAWVDGASLGSTTTGAQWATARLFGVSDADHNAGFRLRWNGSGSGVLLALSGTQWKVEGGSADASGALVSAPAANALFRAEVAATGTLTVSLNGTVLATKSLGSSLPGLQIVPSVWQSSATTQMKDIQSNVGVVASPSPSVTPTTPSPSTSVTPSTSVSPSTTPVSGASWISGASSIYAVDGSYAAWRGEPVGIVGTWSDSKDCSATVCSMGGDLTNLHSGAVDIAIGAIWSGQNWSTAATGAYNPQWTQTLNSLKTVLQQRGISPANVYIRFAHEMNGDWTEWNVKPGQENDFKNAIARFSSLRYQVFGETGAPKVVLCPNDGTSGGQANPHNLFVGRDGLNRRVVDVYCIDTYNQYPHRTDANQIWSAFNDTSAADSIESSRAFAQSVGVPFAIGEWGNCGIAAECDGNQDHLGESPAYVQQMNRYFRAHAGDPANPQPGQLLYEVQFNLWTRFALYGSEANQPQTSTAYAAAVWGH